MWIVVGEATLFAFLLGFASIGLRAFQRNRTPNKIQDQLNKSE